MSKPIRAFIVDDSAVVRKLMSELLVSSPMIEVIGTAADPIFAEKKMEKDWPDVVLLDIEMPRMDGLTFLRKIMAERPTPVIICSTLTERGARASLEALSAGAVEVIAKPKLDLQGFLSESGASVIKAVTAAARARPRQRPATMAGSLAPAPAAVRSGAMASMPRFNRQLVAIGTSTGGTTALEAILTMMPAQCPPIVVVQHMPEKFTTAFAQRLNQICECEVREAANGDQVKEGVVLIAPGGRHMEIRKGVSGYAVVVRDGPTVSGHRPSVDVLFRSVARVAGAQSRGIIMTGMGRDGAQGLLSMREAGARTVAQNEESCVVFGMPKEAIALGAAEEVIPLDSIPAYILQP